MSSLEIEIPKNVPQKSPNFFVHWSFFESTHNATVATTLNRFAMATPVVGSRLSALTRHYCRAYLKP